MPKVINQTSVSVDSLQAKLTLLESQFSRISNEHIDVLIQLKSYKEALKKVDLATSFYDTHLATYTTIFSVLITVILGLTALISWYSLISPLKNDLAILEKKVEDLFPKFKKDELDPIVKELNYSTNLLYRNMALAYKNSEPEVSFRISLKLLKLFNKMNVSKEEKSKWIGKAEHYLNDCKFIQEYHIKSYRSIMNNINYLISKSNIDSDKERLQEIIVNYSVKIKELKERIKSQTEISFDKK